MRHLINAFHNKKLIATFFRDSTDKNVDVIYKILSLERFYDNNLDTENTIELGEKEIYESLLLLEDYQNLKEIDFLKPCLRYLRSLSENEKIELVFSKTKID